MVSYVNKFGHRLFRGRVWKDSRLVGLAFARYLDSMDGKTIIKRGFDSKRCQTFSQEIPCITRFCEAYRKGIYAKFSQLEKWYKEHKTPVYLMTLTTSSKNKTIKEAFEVLRDGWRKLSHILRRIRDEKGIDLEYVYVYEPHKSGYPHMHVVLFGNLDDDDFERLRQLWSKLYKIGSYEHGLDISKPRVHQEIEHVRAYVLKYLQKSMSVDDMDISHFVFLANLWSFYDKRKWTQKKISRSRNGKWKIESTGGGAFRLWSASRALSQIMSYKPSEFDATDYGVTYLREDDEVPEMIERIAEESLILTVSYLDSISDFISQLDLESERDSNPVFKKPLEKG